MKEWMHKIEVIVDKLIPPMLVVLLFVIVVEIWFQEFAEHYHMIILLLDYAVLIVFVLDVIFKYIRIKPFKSFLRKSWLDILAIFPFATLFRAFEALFGVSEALERGQMILHEGVEVEKELAKTEKGVVRITQEAEKVAKASRTSRFARFIRPITRSPRFVKAFTFYEKPTGKHHHHEKLKRGEKMKEKSKGHYCWNCIVSAILSAAGIYSLVLGVNILWDTKVWFVLDAFLIVVLGVLFLYWGKDLKKVCPI